MSTESTTEQAPVSDGHSVALREARAALDLLQKILGGAEASAVAQANGSVAPGDHLGPALACGEHIADLPKEALDDIGCGLMRIADIVEPLLMACALTAMLRERGLSSEQMRGHLAGAVEDIRAARAGRT
jgi:hypothetical protein